MPWRRHREYDRSLDMRHRHAPVGPGQELRQRPRAGGLGLPARRDRHDRPHHLARADQVSVRLGAGLSLQSVPGEETTRSICRKKRTSRTSWDSTPSSSKSAPFVNKPGVRFDNQAKFHPRKYLLALLRLLCSGKGCQVFEQTSVDEIEGTPITATTSDGARIHCEHVLIATHVPLQGQVRPCCPRRCFSRSWRPTARMSSAAGFRAAPCTKRSTGIREIPTTTCASIAGTTTTSSSSAAKITRPASSKTPSSASAASSSGSNICFRRLRSRIGGRGRSSKPTTVCRTSVKPPSGNTSPPDSRATA